MNVLAYWIVLLQIWAVRKDIKDIYELAKVPKEFNVDWPREVL